MSKLVRLWLAAAVCGAVVFCWALPAFGQAAAEDFRNFNDLPYKDREIEEMRRVCATTALENAEIDRLLLEWKTELDPLQVRADADFAAFRAMLPEQRTQGEKERVRRILRELERQQEAIDTRFTRRLAQYLDREGEVRWAGFERWQRRFRIMGKREREYCAEGINVLAFVEAFGLTEEERGAAAAVLAAYEREVDRVLIEVKQREDELHATYRMPAGEEKEEARAAAREASWAAERKLGRLNRDFTARVAAVMAPERGLALKEKFERASCVEAYGPEEVSLAILAAPEVPGLDEPTRARLATLAREWAAQDKPYERQIAEGWRRFERLRLEEMDAERAEWDRLRIERHNRRAKTMEAIREIMNDEQWGEMWAEAGRQMAAWRRERVR